MLYSMQFTILIFLYGVQQGFCLKCYSCVSTKTEACIKFDKNKVPLKKCNLDELSVTRDDAKDINNKMSKYFNVDIGAQDPLVPTNCLKQITKRGDKEIVLRGCQLAAADQLDICDKVKDSDTDTVKTTYCSLCNTEGCNGATLKRPLAASLLTLIFLMAGFSFYC